MALSAVESVSSCASQAEPNRQTARQTDDRKVEFERALSSGVICVASELPWPNVAERLQLEPIKPNLSRVASS